MIRKLSIKILWLGLLISASNYATGRSSTQIDIPAGAFISLERTICYECAICRPCPIYKLTIAADGTVIFNGLKNVRVIGQAKGKISNENLSQLISEFEKVNYFALKDSYKMGDKDCPMSITDQPSAITSITINGRTKTIEHYYGCVTDDRNWSVYPEGLFSLEKKIDEAVNTKQWIE